MALSGTTLWLWDLLGPLSDCDTSRGRIMSHSMIVKLPHLFYCLQFFPTWWQAQSSSWTYFFWRLCKAEARNGRCSGPMGSRDVRFYNLESGHNKAYKMTCAPSKDSTQPANRTVWSVYKAQQRLIRLRGCARQAESLLGPHVILVMFCAPAELKVPIVVLLERANWMYSLYNT